MVFSTFFQKEMPDPSPLGNTSLNQSAVPIDPLSDGHIHTALCNHAVGQMEDYVLTAIAKGLQEIVFLEHMEEGIRARKTTWLSEKDFDLYFEEGQRMQEKYSERISIGLGVEVGYNPQFREILLKRLCRRKWDRIGVSYHYHKIEGEDRHLNLVSRHDARVLSLEFNDSNSIIECYYNALIEAVNFLPGTVLCHLDAVLRHHSSIKTTKQQLPLIDKLLGSVKKNQMALEINTSGMAIRKDFFPTKKIVVMAREKGIPLVAGSDAPKPEDVGRYFSQLRVLQNLLLS